MPDDRSISRRGFFFEGLILSQAAAAAILGVRFLRGADVAEAAQAGCELTTPDVLGPYYVSGAPNRSVIASADEPGTRLFITGRIFAENCATPLSGAIVDAWQANNAGCYSRVQTCPDEDPWNLRGQMLTDANGDYALETILPGYYPGRCRHIHWRFVPVAGPVLVTQLYFQGDPQIPSDPFARLPAAANRIIPLTQEADGLHGVFNLTLDVSATDVGDEGPDPEVTHLYPAFPNPFREETRIRFSLPQAGPVDLSVYDSTGRRVRRLVSRSMGIGYHTVEWDGIDEGGRPVRVGAYFLRLSAGGRTQTQKSVRVD